MAPFGPEMVGTDRRLDARCPLSYATLCLEARGVIGQFAARAREAT